MIILIIVVVIVIAFAIFLAVMRNKLKTLETMTYTDCINYVTEKDSNIKITTGVLKDGKIEYHVYGLGGKEIDKNEYFYEIGSITKTITCSILCKAISEGKINLDDTIDKYLDIPNLSNENHYPTIRELATHTSGYGGFIHSPLIKNTIDKVNPFLNFNDEDLLQLVSTKKLKDKNYKWEYSNFGMSVLGSILGKVYGKSFKDLTQEYIEKDLGLHNTFVNKVIPEDGFKFWKWNDDDAYLAAGSVVSTISDMLNYAKIHMDSENANDPLHYLALGHKKAKDISPMIRNTVYLDEMCLAWIRDNHNDFVWHNGGTGYQNSYLAFDSKTKTAVVVLSNCSSEYRIPATIIGIKLMNDIRNRK